MNKVLNKVNSGTGASIQSNFCGQPGKKEGRNETKGKAEAAELN